MNGVIREQCNQTGRIYGSKECKRIRAFLESPCWARRESWTVSRGPAGESLAYETAETIGTMQAGQIHCSWQHSKIMSHKLRMFWSF